MLVFSERKAYTKDGYELTIGTNYLGTFALTYGLLPLLKKSEKSRILNIISRAGLYGKLILLQMLFILVKLIQVSWYNWEEVLMVEFCVA